MLVSINKCGFDKQCRLWYRMSALINNCGFGKQCRLWYRMSALINNGCFGKQCRLWYRIVTRYQSLGNATVIKLIYNVARNYIIDDENYFLDSIIYPKLPNVNLYVLRIISIIYSSRPKHYNAWSIKIPDDWVILALSISVGVSSSVNRCKRSATTSIAYLSFSGIWNFKHNFIAQISKSFDTVW
jgi:hypothetical protein